ELIQAAEGPVIDPSCAALLLLARKVHECGYKVALTGEGADEWLAGYPWYRVGRLIEVLDLIPGMRLSPLAFRGYLRVTGAPRLPWFFVQRTEKAVGGPNPWLLLYGLMTMSKLRFFSPETWEALGDHLPYDDLRLNQERMGHWHPLHRALYLGARVLLPGLLL